MYNESAYIFVRNVLYKFDLKTYEFTKLMGWESSGRGGCSGFIIDDDIYIGLGASTYSNYSKEFWKYNILSNEWEKIEDFPGEFRQNAFAFTLSGKGYVGGGFNLISGGSYPKFTDIWCYDPIQNEWKQRNEFPNPRQDNLYLVGAIISDFGYCLNKNAFFEYNPTFNIWTQMSSIPSSVNFNNPYLFSYGNKLFVVEATQTYGKPKHFKIWGYEK